MVKNRKKPVKITAFNRDGIFSNTSSTKHRCFSDYRDLKPLIKKCRKEELKIVLTQGTFDMVHIGHARYFEAAKKHGNILIVGVDSDEKVRNRKGPDRPVVPEDERMEMLTHIRSVDVVVLKDANNPKWALIKMVKPDVLIATKATYTQEQVKQLEDFCGQIVILEPMATTSTSAKIRKLQLGLATKLEQNLTPKLIETIEKIFEEFKK
jgi:D-beta-D-heptose 7-phosphate kinase/D-beta-D-heptose 1-phosphate adenosyltransferase